MKIKKLSEWEKERGFVAIGLNPNLPISEKDMDLISINDIKGCNHDDRIRFLELNGHKVTRENLVDNSLMPRT